MKSSFHLHQNKNTTFVSSMIDYYEVLGISPKACREEIKQCYYRLILEHHPDKSKSSGDSSEIVKEFQLIDEAWKVLNNEVTRQAYDAMLELEHTQSVAVHDRVCLTDMAYNSVNGQYSWNCKCGGVYFLSDADTSYHHLCVECDCCSLSILVLC